MNNSAHYDYIIVGAGPAGAAFVRTLVDLKSPKKILLIDKKAFPRDKVCGDAFTERALSLLYDIFPGLDDASPEENKTKRYTFWYPSGRYFKKDDCEFKVLPRKVIDNQLVNTFRDHVKILENTPVTDLIIEKDTVKGVRIQSNGTQKTIYTNWVIAADGSNSLIRRKLFSRKHPNTVTVVRQYVRGIPPCDDGLVFLIDPENIGYFWFFPFWKENQWWANIGYGGVKTNPRTRFEAYCHHPIIKRYLGDGQFVDGLKGFPLDRATTFGTRLRLPHTVAGKGYILLGDAAGLIHPYTGEGISLALYSGRLAAQLLSENLPTGQLAKTYKKGVLQFIRGHYCMNETFLIFHLPCLLPKWLQNTYVEWLIRSQKNLSETGRWDPQRNENLLRETTV